MKQKIIFLLFLSLNGLLSAKANNIICKDSSDTETIVLIRHGEKPQGGLGQLSCKGLNRALALPKILIGKFGKPQYIFAPHSLQKVDDAKYFYVRPLVTIEPTAIYCGLPVNTEYGYLEIEGLQNEMLEPKYKNATIFIAWEHGYQDAFAKRLVKSLGGDDKAVPGWSNDNYDMIFVFKIKTVNGKKTISFRVDQEGLDNLSAACPV